MKTVLITGGAGFIGSHLSDAYLKAGWKVIAIDDLSTGRLENLQSAGKSSNFTFVEGDIRNDAVIGPAMRQSDLVVHLAARIGLKLVIESPLKTLESNVKGTEVVLRHAAVSGTPTIVASTSEVYGLATKYPSSEEDPVMFGSPTAGRWSYACSKAYDESLSIAHHRENGLPAIVVRLFNTVGPRQTARYGMVLPRFIRQALAGEPLTVYGAGDQTRCFGHVADIVGGLMRLAQEPKAIGQVINLGNPHEIAIADLAKKILQATGSSAEIKLVPFEEAYGAGFEEIMRRVPDIEKARKLIGFAPQFGLDDIVRDVVEEQRLHFAAAGASQP
ncbi:MAG: SDR family NAD(P)-dependent oxidoreductase [Candidatus Eremiobacteraeota bacterium]|nr:SDR family NAD(P)-dependent oxidoreductase [Candidatus Eremiobacteraeota bacterium]